MNTIAQKTESANGPEAAFRKWLADNSPAECLFCGAQGESVVIFTPLNAADAARFGLGPDELLLLSVCPTCRWQATDEKLMDAKVRELMAARAVKMALALVGRVR